MLILAVTILYLQGDGTNIFLLNVASLLVWALKNETGFWGLFLFCYVSFLIYI